MQLLEVNIVLNFPCDDLSINFTKTSNLRHSIATISLSHFSLLIPSFPPSFSLLAKTGQVLCCKKFDVFRYSYLSFLLNY